MDLNALTTLALTYPEVGATAADHLPEGYHHVNLTARIGAGRQRFQRAADSVMRYGMQRGSGIRVQASSDLAAVDTVLVVGFGVVRAPCRVVYVVDEPDRRGFAYGTLSGHPESGEELFSVRYDPRDDMVYAQVRAFSRHAAWWARAAPSLTRFAQRLIITRYLRAV